MPRKRSFQDVISPVYGISFSIGFPTTRRVCGTWRSCAGRTGLSVHDVGEWMNRIEPSGHDSCAGACDYQGTVTAGTVFAKTRTPLRSWFAGVWYVTSQKHGVSYQTAWTMMHRLRRAMVRPARERLSGKVEVDETYVGGPGRGLGRKNTIHMRHWRNDTSKAIVVVAVEVHEPKGFGRIRMRRVPQASGKYLLPFVSETIAPGSLRSHRRITHLPVVTPNGATVTDAVSLLDRKALRTSRCLACTALPLCLRDGCWELTRGPSKRVSLTTISTNTLFGLIVGRRARAVCFSTDCLSRLSRPSPSHIATIVTKNS